MPAVSPLYELAGPFLSAFVTLPPPSEDTREQLDVRLRHVREDLEAAGFDPSIVDDVPLDAEDQGTGASLAVLATKAGLARSAVLRDEVTEQTIVESLPCVVPLVA